MKVRLRNYQEEGVNSLRLAFMRGTRCSLYVLPTGGGKTVIFSHIAERAAQLGNRIAILVHRQELVDQASRSLDSLAVKHGVIAAGRSMDLSHGVQVASVQTLVRRLHRIPPDFFQLLIVDEAHHAVAGSWAKVIDHYASAKVLGVTATPERLDGRGLGAFFGQMVLGPDAAWLTEHGFLAPARVFAPPSKIDLSGVRKLGGDFRMDEAQAQLERAGIMGDAVTHYRRHLAPGTAIAFCCTVAHAQAVADEFNAQGIPAAVVDGTMDKDARRQLIEDLGAGRLKVLASCQIISEGTDVPSVTGAILLRPTQSLSLFLQQVGRCLRPAPGKSHAIIMDHVGNTQLHGLPTDPREWSLEGRKKRDRDAAPPVKVCGQCFACVPSGCQQCPCCGNVFETQARELAVYDGDLVELPPYRLGDELAVDMGQGRWDGGWIVRGILHPKRHLVMRNRTHGAQAEDLMFGYDEVRLVRRGKDDERAQAQSLEDLQALAARRGYSPGWAHHVWQARQNRHGTRRAQQ
jgi:superfamily II DNA or RNA helicase